MSAPTPRTFVFAGGGTGGHIFPALALAEQLADLAPDSRFVFLCSTRPLDAEILGAETIAGRAVEFLPLPAQPPSLRPLAAARFVGSWGRCVRAARAALREIAAANRAPILVAMGGFVAAPAAQAARVQRVPIALVNLDALPGRANRWIARHARAVFTAARCAEPGWVHVPPIVRRAALAPAAAPECRARLGLEPARPTLLVTGASQGARSINLALERLVETKPGVLTRRGWQVIHQTGKGDELLLRDAYQRAGVRALVTPFLPAIGLAWGAADLAISRCGAGSVAEAWANRVPTIFFPYPFHKDQHQRLNARPLVDTNAAFLLDDRVNPALNADALLSLASLFEEPSALEPVRAALTRLAPADGAVRIARALLDLR